MVQVFNKEVLRNQASNEGKGIHNGRVTKSMPMNDHFTTKVLISVTNYSYYYYPYKLFISGNHRMAYLRGKENIKDFCVCQII